jgi:hypothetical protein
MLNQEKADELSKRIIARVGNLYKDDGIISKLLPVIANTVVSALMEYEQMVLDD